MESTINIAQQTKFNIISSAHGKIEKLLLAIPEYSEHENHIRVLIDDILKKLPEYCQVEIVVQDNVDTISMVKSIIDNHNTTRRCHIIVKKGIENLKFWIQDPFIVTSNSKEIKLLTPSNQQNSIVKFLENSRIYPVQRVPISFHGGNILVADDFVLIGANHYVINQKQLLDTFERPTDINLDAETKNLLKEYLGVNMEIIPVGNSKYHNQSMVEPFPHIDLYITLAGRNTQGQYQLLVGKTVAANPKDYHLANSLNHCIEPIVAELTKKGFAIIRNPIPLTRGKVFEGDTYYCYYNNCLVEIDNGTKRVWIPTFGHDKWSEQLKEYDTKNKEIWHQLGFDVIELMNFHPFVNHGGGIHCITKCIKRVSTENDRLK